MLSEEEKHEIAEEARHYDNKHAMVIEAMKIVQEHRGWVSAEAMAEVGALLDFSITELDSVASFYNMLFNKRVGRHVILVCNSISCWVMGYENLRDQISARLGIGLGETTPDDRFTFLPRVCLGACDRAPAMIVDRDLYGPVSPDELDAILAKYE
jgi:NADH-quinone oxidoreductase subunit E